MAAKNKLNDLWETLSKTDPSHTKSFKRAGGFSGTAVKPMWVWSRLTELFGPCGTGWGFGEPQFQVVHAEKETLVYCTVSAWHGERTNTLWGVGGDKVVTLRKDGGAFCDDEAFKKAFTDALMNAFKFIGVAADVHMGLFDDHKYVQAVRKEFAGGSGAPVEQDIAHPPADKPVITDARFAELSTLISTAGADVQGICEFYKVSALNELTQEMHAHCVQQLRDAIEAQTRKAA